ncbi:MAG TPA: hypothetical protein VMD29_01300 [Terracidiphilus sp.]|nr:hypothetical protein [Terracidiphilus sp.]
MTLALLRQRVRDLNARRRRELFTTVFAAAIVLALSVWGIPRTHSIALQIAFVLSSAWALAGLYFIKRGLRNAELLDDSTLHTGLDFYRLQIQQNLTVSNRILPWTLGPVNLAVVAIALVLAGIAQSQNQPLSRIAPFCILFVLWLIAFPVVRFRKRRELRRELDLLSSLESGK